jgi:4-hydroxythreonine-4-phosphate dehydrogenase
VLGDHGLFAERARKIGLRVHLRDCDTVAHVGPHLIGSLQILPVALRTQAVAGRLDVANAAYVLDMLRRGAALCSAGAAQALVTAPVQKSVITESGVRFSGHTELLAELTRTPLPVMLLAGKSLRSRSPPRICPFATCLRARRHGSSNCSDRERRPRGPFPYRAAADPRARAESARRRKRHARRRERRIIEPVVRKLAAEGLAVVGPVSADTAFTAESLETCDVVVAMYHDQGLPVIKALSFGEIVNVTLGLPIVRTSVDHGTALSLAGTGRAREGSLLAAVELALDLCRAPA